MMQTSGADVNANKRKSLLRFFLVAFFAVSVYIVCAYFAPGFLIVRVDPPDSTLIISGREYRATKPVRLIFRKGAVLITAQREGRLGFTETVVIRPMKASRINITLPDIFYRSSVKIGEEPPWTMEPVFWGVSPDLDIFYFTQKKFYKIAGEENRTFLASNDNSQEITLLSSFDGCDQVLGVNFSPNANKAVLICEGTDDQLLNYLVELTTSAVERLNSRWSQIVWLDETSLAGLVKAEDGSGGYIARLNLSSMSLEVGRKVDEKGTVIKPLGQNGVILAESVNDEHKYYYLDFADSDQKKVQLDIHGMALFYGSSPGREKTLVVTEQDEARRGYFLDKARIENKIDLSSSSLFCISDADKVFYYQDSKKEAGFYIYSFSQDKKELVQSYSPRARFGGMSCFRNEAVFIEGSSFLGFILDEK